MRARSLSPLVWYRFEDNDCREPEGTRYAWAAAAGAAGLATGVLLITVLSTAAAAASDAAAGRPTGAVSAGVRPRWAGDVLVSLCASRWSALPFARPRNAVAHAALIAHAGRVGRVVALLAAQGLHQSERFRPGLPAQGARTRAVSSDGEKGLTR